MWRLLAIRIAQWIFKEGGWPWLLFCAVLIVVGVIIWYRLHPEEP